MRIQGESFNNFQSSAFLEQHENYKYGVCDEAKKALQQKFWDAKNVGTGEVQRKVSSAIQSRIHYKDQWYDNNLVDWRKKDEFVKRSVNAALEQTLFDFYKNKTRDATVFAKLLDFRLSYQLIAYLFFIKKNDQYMPITQDRFDKAFELLGIQDFKTSGNASWENYSKYMEIIREVRDFLKTKDKAVTLIDAHSFLYVLVSQMRNEEFYPSKAKTITQDAVYTFSGESTKISTTPEESFAHPTYPDELPEDNENLFEGMRETVIVNAYERNELARRKCITHWKAVCAVCNFDFEKRYGVLGRGFIHVHHLLPLSEIGEQYEVDPINDLRPVCPNCHAMLHRSKKTLTIEELRSFLL